MDFCFWVAFNQQLWSTYTVPCQSPLLILGRTAALQHTPWGYYYRRQHTR